MFKSITAPEELACLELNLNDTNVNLSEIVSLMDVIRNKYILTELALKISHIRMNLKDVKTVLKPIRGIHSLRDL